MIRSSLSACQIPTPASDEEIYRYQKRLIDEGRGAMWTTAQINALPRELRIYLEEAKKFTFGDA
jgi:hypothetical protein